MAVDPAMRFTVSELTARIKQMLERGFPSVLVEGEISNARPSAAGHLYFTLKDEDASLSAVMFRGRASGLDFAPADGQLVMATGSISVYPPRGNYQIIVERMQLAGTGRILAELEERKRRFAAEGLFDEDRKKRLPLLPARVAVVTSPTGAALRDILQVLGRRHAGVDVVICPTPVQGAEAPPRIAAMIRAASEHNLGDVIIVGRGGGSIEDLLPFSDEEVVRAVAESPIPVISAVGHEIDWALVDFAADHRAPTPSAAAELVTSSREELAYRVMDLGRSVIASFGNRLARARLARRQFTPDQLHRAYEVIAHPILQGFDHAREDLLTAMMERTRAARHSLELASTELKASSPFQILKRGYAVVRTTSGKVVRQAREVAPGDGLSIQLSSGGLETTVREIHDNEEL